MVHGKRNHSAGYSLIEVLVSITILGLVVVPIGSSLVLSFRLNARSDQMLHAQLAVSSAVETLMAQGFDPSYAGDPDPSDFEKKFGVEITRSNPLELNGSVYIYEIDLESVDYPDVSVSTQVRPAPADPEGGGGT